MNEPPATPTEPSTTRRISPKAIAAVAGAVLGGLVLAIVLLNLPRGETGDASDGLAECLGHRVGDPSASTPPTASAPPTPTPPLTGAAPMTWTAGTPPDGLVNDIVRVPALARGRLDR